MNVVSSDIVRSFWDRNPLSAKDIPFAPGSREYFHYYDTLRERIESVEFSAWLHEYSRFVGKRVLDVGIGNGYVLRNYARAGALVSGVDISQTAIDLSTKRFAYEGLKADLRTTPAEQLPFDDDTFDCVCSMGVLHHVADMRRAIAEIRRVLKPGGRLIVMLYHRNSAQYQIKYRLVALLKRRDMRDMVNEFDGAGNPRGDVYSTDDLPKVFKDFVIDESTVGFLTGNMVLPRVGTFIPQFLLRPFERALGWNLYAKGHKPSEMR
jgi:ubiquinone/menaquinone biosynthesis C-methylase UbiE